jgi:hypothetical protein
MSLHSSAGNHTIAESVGLVYAGVLFPEFREAGAWKDKGIGTLRNEADRQILSDGGGIERSLWYHLFVTDLCGLALALLEHKGVGNIDNIKAAFRRARDFLGEAAEGPDDLPRIGDADNGYALSMHLRMSWPDRAGRNRLAVFETTGISVIKGLEHNEALYFNHGPLGMPPFYGHGHAHALSVVLKCDGEFLLVDPGTYTYTGSAAWRRYFRSTEAHNTVCVDGEDQAKQYASFIWTEPYNCSLAYNSENEGAVVLLACHDGYRRDKGVVHWRGIIYLEGCGCVIWDYLSGKEAHELQLNWHTRNATESGAGRFRLNDRTEMTVTGGKAGVTPGSDATYKGWLSDAYGMKYSGKCITCSYRGDLPHEFVTRLSTGGCEIAGKTVTEYLQLFKRIINATQKD